MNRTQYCRDQRARLRARGRCIDCKNPHPATTWRCKECLAHQATLNRLRARRLWLAGVCTRCAKAPRVHGSASCVACKAKWKVRDDERARKRAA